MTKYLLNTLILLLVFILYRGKLTDVFKKNKESGKGVYSVIISLAMVLAGVGIVRFLTFSETCIVAIFMAVGYLLRELIVEFCRTMIWGNLAERRNILSHRFRNAYGCEKLSLS